MSNYLQFEFEGKSYGWKFNQPTYAFFKSKTSGFTKEDFEAFSLYHLLYAGLKTNAVIKGVALDLTWEKSCEFADTLSEDQILYMMQIFIDELKFAGAFKDDTKKKIVKKKTVKIMK